MNKIIGNPRAYPRGNSGGIPKVYPRKYHKGNPMFCSISSACFSDIICFDRTRLINGHISRLFQECFFPFEYKVLSYLLVIKQKH